MKFDCIRIWLSAVFMLLAATAFSVSAQERIRLTGKIFDALTSHEMNSAKVRMLDSSGNVVDSTKVVSQYYVEKVVDDRQIYGQTALYYLSAPKKEGKYVIEVTSDGYEIMEFPFEMTNIGRREVSRKVPNIYMKKIRKVQELAEVTVRASKVKFYNKGDTIVYNADAFDLPEGSMLDALVRQLPGVEIRDGGMIYVNGKYVESLLLNGKDFFKGNQQVALDNLGAYMVKDIRVYEKLGRVGELMGKKAGDEEYVMDVRLKKDYMAGNLLNIQAGAGTHGRWLGKLFGMHYTNNSRTTVYGSANNVNDNDKPNDGARNWYRAPGSGISKIYRGGIDYFADNPRHTFEVNGNADFSMRDRSANTDTYRTNFLTGGNTYDYTFSRPRLKDLSVTTAHKLTLKKESCTLDIKPSFSYNHDRSTVRDVYASFYREIEGIGAGDIEGLFSPKVEGLGKAFINRQISDSKTKGHGFRASFFSEFLLKIPKTSDVTSVWLETSYNDYRSDRDNIQDIRYADDMISDMIRKQIMHSVPNRNFMLHPGMKYYYGIKNGTMGILYNFRHNDNKKSTDLFLINARMEGDDAIFDDADAVFDPQNSYTSRAKEDSHLIRPFFTQRYAGAAGMLTVKVSPEFSFYHRKLDYHRDDIAATPVKNDFTVRIMDTYIDWNSNNYEWMSGVSYGRTPQLASLVDMVDYRDTSDPLNIQEGNPDLKNSYFNNIGFHLTYYHKRKIYHSLLLNASWTENDIVRGYRYDSASGVRTFKAYNVSGNHSLDFSYDLAGRWNLWGGEIEVSERAGYRNSVYADMVGYDADPTRQRVTNNVFTESLSFDFRKGWFYFGPGASLEYRRTKSESSEFRAFNAVDFSYGVHGDMKAPFGLEIQTDITMNSRRGYSQPAMNDNRLLWNARATYRMLGGKLLLILQARDILGKEKSLSYSVNGQGRTETRYQILPRYVMLTAQFRLDFKPKRLKD